MDAQTNGDDDCMVIDESGGNQMSTTGKRRKVVGDDQDRSNSSSKSVTSESSGCDSASSGGRVLRKRTPTHLPTPEPISKSRNRSRARPASHAPPDDEFEIDDIQEHRSKNERVCRLIAARGRMDICPVGVSCALARLSGVGE
jgi:hypothetical protein